MTAKQKAKELVDKLHGYAYCDSHQPFIERFEQRKFYSKKCALLFVDEILNGTMLWNAIDGERRIFWNQVKEEIEAI